jgi:hypothetical protein
MDISDIKDKGFRKRIAEAEDHLSYVWVFRQETGEEGFVHEGSLSDAIERHPEWAYSHSELVKDAAYHKWVEVCEDYKFWKETKDMDEDELEDYLDCLNYEYDYDDMF